MTVEAARVGDGVWGARDFPIYRTLKLLNSYLIRIDSDVCVICGKFGVRNTEGNLLIWSCIFIFCLDWSELILIMN